LESRYFATETPRNRLLRWIAQQTLPRADAVRVVNWQEKAGCVRLGLPSERVCVIPLVPNITQFATADHSTEAAAWRQRLQATAETPILLWVGRPVTFKNLPLLLDTFALIRRDIPAAKLIIAGNLEGTTVPAMITARGLDEAVHTPGSIPHHELPGLFQAATMYLLTSNYEGLPGVLLEASAAALPIVSTANNGAKDLINDGETGILAPIGDAPALARACLDLIRHPERRQQIGQAARKSVFQHYNEQTLMNRWVDMWRHVAAKVPPCDY
jgi:glycosyltransferase involved in cell wall biosynthesis